MINRRVGIAILINLGGKGFNETEHTENTDGSFLVGATRLYIIPQYETQKYD